MKRFLSTFIALALSTVMLAGLWQWHHVHLLHIQDGAKSDKTYNIGVIPFTDHTALDHEQEKDLLKPKRSWLCQQQKCKD